ncbi:MAG: HAMP domain-containing protein [Anaerolineae bacterium]|nr:HAMP domain-containing protein [Anaerolineae bacterium]
MRAVSAPGGKAVKLASVPRGAPRRGGLRRRGLRTKIILWFLVPTLLILGVVALLAYSTAQRGTEELVFARSEDRARLLANQLSGELEGYRQMLAVAAAQVVDEDASALTAALDAWPMGTLAPFDAGVLLLDRDGLVRAATAGLARVLETRQLRLVAAVAWESESGVHQDLGYSSVLFDIAGELDAVLVPAVVPVVDAPAGSGEEPELALVGLFRVEQQAVRTSALYNRIWELYIGRLVGTEAANDLSGNDAISLVLPVSQDFPQPETAYLVDAQGIVIFHPDTYMIGSDFSGRDVVASALGGQLGPMRAENPGGLDIVATAARVPRTSWFLVTETSWEAVTVSARATTRLMLLLLALGVLLPVVIVTAGVGRITRPLARLTEAARAVAGGRFDQRIELDTGDELETLADQFNTMSAELRRSYATLEQRVADRTRELATLNAVASTVSRSLDLGAVLEDALLETLAATGLEVGAAFRLDGDVLVLMAQRGLSHAFAEAVARLSVGQAETPEPVLGVAGTAAGAAVASGALVVRRVAAYPPGTLRELLAAEGIETVISVPLVVRDRAVGVLNLVDRGDAGAVGDAAARGPGAEDALLSPEMRSLLAAIGQQVGVAVENAALYEQAEATAAAAERNRLARELHDAVSQTLFTASLIADTLPPLWERNPDEALRQLATLRRLTRGAQAEMRTLLLELRPAALVETDLEILLGHLGRAVAARADVDAVLMLEPVGPVPVDTKIALYRIAQEALNNVAKHADADRVTIALGPTATGPQLEIRDDGRGFDPAAVPPDHFGLQTMRERAAAMGAELTVRSAEGEGTVVIVRMGE